ncbi:hypothetical protein [Arenibaculum pallidiluteum]|uniref:hypothetical protein n=1 Tax=Arenibaculum pallidiluteum TaxID=2812559 RepID=UPI001A971406|nr:hypothetical protein [Arenibaculum pallidiluteum]
MTLDDARRETEDFLTRQMVEAFRTVEYALPEPREDPDFADLQSLGRARVELAHARGASDAFYRIHAFGDVLGMSVQCNVRRLVAVYSIPAGPPLDARAVSPHFERWAIGAGHAGWLIGWHDGRDPGGAGPRVDAYCYAAVEPDFLANDLHKLYWRTDLVQMTRHFMLAAAYAGLRLHPA